MDTDKRDFPEEFSAGLSAAVKIDGEKSGIPGCTHEGRCAVGLNVWWCDRCGTVGSWDCDD